MQGQEWTGSSDDDLRLLESRGELVYVGPPGAGKTWRALSLAERLIRSVALTRPGGARYGTKHDQLERAVKDNVHVVQLHPACAYGDFVGSLRAEKSRVISDPRSYLPKLVERIEKQRTSEANLPQVVILDEVATSALGGATGDDFSSFKRGRDGETVVSLAVAPGGSDPVLRLWDASWLYFIGTVNLST